MQLPQTLADHLQSHPVCATSLALKRSLEVTYGRPDATTGKMVDFLLQAQEADGSFGFAPLPTACGLAALHSVLNMAPLGSLPAIRPQTLNRAYESAKSAILTMLNDEAKHGLVCCCPEQTPLLTQSDALDWAYVLLLLSDDPQLANHPAADQLHHWFYQHQRQLPQATMQIWQRTCWSPAPAPGSSLGSARSNRSLRNLQTQGGSDGATDWDFAATTNHGRDVRQPSGSTKPSHGRFHQSPRSNLRRSPRPVRHEQS
ncbi:MAG: hypothetical protein CMJ19_08090 [Phycisphaeraceae bacterium]|nr:hypothetical protein [Phycisphaeraceae bacterium]